jgi:hypothetical protein
MVSVANRLPPGVGGHFRRSAALRVLGRLPADLGYEPIADSVASRRDRVVGADDQAVAETEFQTVLIVCSGVSPFVSTHVALVPTTLAISSATPA